MSGRFLKRSGGLFATLVALPLSLPLAGPALAELSGDLEAYKACALQFIDDNQDNFMAPVVAPVICGERHIPIRQSCAWAAYLVLENRRRCTAEDLQFWQAELERLEGRATSEGRHGRGALYESGMERCAGLADEDEAETCRAEVSWRTALEFLMAQALADRDARGGKNAD